MNGQAKTAVVMLSLLLAAGCGNLTERERNTAVGAAVGGVAGSVLTGGETGGAVGGAVVGGVIGNQIKK
ncbi:osmotically inducible lipoprotein OsmB [Janthinobacterium sp. CG_23.3]|uniref:glycine zipper 2TM domain-containing protein n=1 Tax=unclassified Janthinobacterium TaxID=2610881 RepID=UPI0004765155|nr:MULTISPECIES: glycine zipper 2TM domain-containing protein [unclassified Janthinobacterium]MEC5163198.1 osmotically inducible lipoprotein OsmB [Janthinobacterium sp. CG_S6]